MRRVLEQRRRILNSNGEDDSYAPYPDVNKAHENFQRECDVMLALTALAT
jgi:hypothetical protein